MVEPEGFIGTHTLIRGGGRDPVTLTIESRLGVGGQATVYRGNMSNLGDVAIRRVNITKPGVKYCTQCEIKSLKNTRLSAKENKAGPANVEGCDPHINCFYGVIRSTSQYKSDLSYEYANDELADGGTYLHLIYELIPGTSLRDILDAAPAVAGAGAGAGGEVRRLIPKDQAISFTRQLLAGVASMHAANIAHLDLKPENIMITEDGVLKIIDFGLAKAANDYTAFPGFTLNYLAPEGWLLEYIRTHPSGIGLLMKSIVDLKSLDMFAVGCIIYELFAGTRLFPGIAGTAGLETLSQIDVSDLPDEHVRKIVLELLKFPDLLVGKFKALVGAYGDFAQLFAKLSSEIKTMKTALEKPNLKKENVEKFQVNIKSKDETIKPIREFLGTAKASIKAHQRPTAAEALVQWNALFPLAAGGSRRRRSTRKLSSRRRRCRTRQHRK